MLKRFFAAFLATFILMFNFACATPCLAQYAQKTQYGTNVEPSNYFSSDAMYVDVFMHASGWWTNPSTNVPLTPQGFPASGTATTLFWMDGYPSGDYKFYGKGKFTLNPRGGNFVDGTLKTEGDVTTALIHIDVPPPSVGGYYGAENSKQCLFDLTVTDPNDPPSDLHLIHPDYPAWPNTNAVFNKKYLQTLAPFQVMRMMDWMNTNWSTVSSWSDRPNPDFYGDGNRNIAYERFIDLANTAHCDLWINIPLNATDDWSTNFAKLVAQRLDKRLHCYYEYSNETWNWGFAAWGVIQQQAQGNAALTATGDWERHAQQCMFDFMHHVTLMQPILGSMGRPVFAAQMAGVSYSCAPALDWLNTTYGPPSQFIWGISGAAYFSQSSADPNPTTLSDLFVSMNDNLNSEIGTQAKQYTDLARRWNLQFCCYEAGQSLYAFGDQNLFAFYDSAQYDPQMGVLYQNLAKILESNGTYLCCFFHFIGHDTRYGFWGALPDLAFMNSGGTVKYNAEAGIALAGEINDDRKSLPGQPNPPVTGGSPGTGSIRKKIPMPMKPPKGWPTSPGMGRKMTPVPKPNKLVMPHH